MRSTASQAEYRQLGATPDDEPRLELLEVDPFYVSIGDVVAGKYRVERVLGVGGMAFVLAAKHVELDERFALKFLSESFLDDPAVIERFMHEAKAACRLRSEHVARVYDVGIHEGAPFLVMEHLDGRDLQVVVAQGGALNVEDAVEYAMQACEALATAHRHGIVHRDIKPENLFLVEHEGLPSIKLLDFGISKVALVGGVASSRLTGELTLGTPCYMSPEQIRSTASADAQSDLWSLGAVLYELLAGREAFRASSVTELCAAVLESEPTPLCEVRPEVPRELAAVVEKCLEKDPSRRFADVAELAVALLPFAPRRAIVNAERSSSLMRSARASTTVPRVSSIRPSAKPPAELRVSDMAEPTRSDAPVASASIAAPPRAPMRRRGALGVVGAGLLIASAFAFAFTLRTNSTIGGLHVAPASPAVAVADPSARSALIAPVANVPVAVRPAPPPSLAPSFKIGAARGPKPVVMPVRSAPPVGSAAPVKGAPPVGSVAGSAALPAPLIAKEAAPSAPVVELGY